MRKYLSILGLVAVVLLFTQCASLNEFKRVEKGASPIGYEQLDNYFVRNDVPCTKLQKLIFDSQYDFEKYFGEAAVMGTNGQPTNVNWAKQYVVAVILPETDRSTVVTPVNVCQNDKSVILYYNVQRGEKNSYKIVPFVAVALDKPADPQGMEFYFIEK